MRRLVFVILALTALPASAIDYFSLADAAVMYDAPSLKATPLFAIARHTPVEVVVTLEGWCKVRDAAGSMAWVEKRQVSEKRTVLVTAHRAQVRSQPEPNAAIVFEAEKDVVLELVEPLPVAGWAKIRHRSGQGGFIRVNQVWGV
ncbi:MAG: SH3 domain-containing protein [Sterolibacterium sp.]|nr:SH3 domain-containing protein [Sterolibacterium sp.]